MELRTGDYPDYPDYRTLSITNEWGGVEMSTTAPYVELTYAGAMRFVTGVSSSYSLSKRLLTLFGRIRYNGAILDIRSFDPDVFINGSVAIAGDSMITGSLTVDGTKSRQVSTENYSRRLLYAYETPTPLFGDIGEAIIDTDGLAYVDIDDIFSETIADKVEYQVFLQKEGEGDCWIEEKTPRYFVITGTPNLKVAWELKAKQRDYDMLRLEQPESGLDEYERVTDIDSLLDAYITEQEDLLYGNY